MFSASKISGPSGYNISRSVRLRSSASANLNRTYSGTGTSATIKTLSMWVKRGSLGSEQRLANSNSSNAATTFLRFDSADTLTFQFEGSSGILLTTTQVFRDPSAWYHIVVAIDTTQATAANRVKIYVNGSQVTAFSASNYPSQNATTTLFGYAAATNRIGSFYDASAAFFDGYLTEINHIDGQALTPTSFGSFNTTTGVWQPIKYSGTYGTNGFYLNFSNNASTTTLGYDTSGNGNNWTANNISLTAGATYDSMTDVPTLTSATAANYCVLNPLTPSGSASNGNLTAPSSGVGMFTTIQLPTTGKWYAEFNPSAYWNTGAYLVYGTMAVANSAGTYSGLLATTNASNGGIYQNGSLNQAFTTWATTDVIGLAVDRGANTVQVYRNGSTLGTAVTLPSGDLWFFVSAYSGGNIINTNFGQQPFTYTPPTGFNALNTQNLPSATIKAGNKYFDASLWTGNGSTQSIVNAGAFQPDLVWLKSRSLGTADPTLIDSVRGVSTNLRSDSTVAEFAASTVTAFNSNGFSIGSYADANTNAATFVGWQWKAGNGSSSNTNGSITSTVSVNATAGFSIVTFTGTGVAGATVGHGLGVVPSMMIVKSRGTTGNWLTYHKSLGNTGGVALEQTTAFSANAGYWNNTSPTSTVLTLGTFTPANTAVAYCWAEVAGFSKFGSYTGNGSTDGPFVYCGFRPRWVMIKRTDSAENWRIFDTARDAQTQPAGVELYANLSNSEAATTDFDYLSNGFKLRNSVAGINASGGTYIFAAFAENPTKYALAR